MMAAAIAFALWYSTTPVPPTSGELAVNASASTSAVAGPAGVVHKLVALKLVTPAIIDASERWLKEFYKAPIGTQQNVVVDGRQLVFVLQWHFHPEGYVGGPTGKHRGVTVFEQQ
ncbi:MAG TPA: hypothetical protein VF765_11200 [Polyangiaceae bacterium]